VSSHDFPTVTLDPRLGPAAAAADPLPDDAKRRIRELGEQVMARYPQQRSAMMPLLYLAQAEQGYVSADGIALVAEMLGLTTAEVAAVSTFYTMYRRKPCGDYVVGVCTNTLCAVLGGDAIFSALKEHLDVDNHGTTPDGKVTLEHIECNAACDYAPVMMVNWEFFDKQTVESAKELVDQLRAGNPPLPTRGAPLHTHTETSRILAGFTDGAAGEGPSAGAQSLAGLELARRRGESAPAIDGEAS
jgi:NADH-quinone oxidoreductase subunit E